MKQISRESQVLCSNYTYLNLKSLKLISNRQVMTSALQYFTDVDVSNYFFSNLKKKKKKSV